MAYRETPTVIDSQSQVKVSLTCVSCSSDYIIIHDKKDVIEYCPMCGSDIIEPEEDDFEENWLQDYDDE